ncbi:MAG TPA: biotin transporter BioY [Clostridiaceae bacterium]
MKTRDLVLVGIFAALTIVGTFIKIPITTVPVTLQFFFCALAGIVLGSRLGALSQLVYVILGLIGIPIFSNGGGIGYLLQPTFGYIIGFVFAAYIIGKGKEFIKNSSFFSLYFILFIGLIIDYLIGVAYLLLIVNLYLHKSMSIASGIMTGVVPFLIKDMILLLLVDAVGVKLVPALKKSQVI